MGVKEDKENFFHSFIHSFILFFCLFVVYNETKKNGDWLNELLLQQQAMSLKFIFYPRLIFNEF